MTRTLLRLAALALAAVPALAGTAAPAAAADSYLSRTTGFAGTADWVQVQELPNPAFGNVHVGFLQAFETRTGFADVFAYIDDYRCTGGALPTGHGESTGCTYVGARQLQGSDVTFTVARKASSATLKGSLTASTPGDPHTGEGGASLGQVPADFTWTATSAAARSRSTYRYQQDGQTISETYNTTSRQTSLQGVLGPMLFQNAVTATGRLEAFKSTTRMRG